MYNSGYNPQYGGQQQPQQPQYGGNPQAPFGAQGYPPQPRQGGWAAPPVQQQPQYNPNYPPLHQQQQYPQQPPQGFAPRYEAPQQQQLQYTPPQQQNQIMPQYSGFNSSVNTGSPALNNTSNSGFGASTSGTRPSANRFETQIVRPELPKVTMVTVDERRVKSKEAAVVFHHRLQKNLTEAGRKLANQEIANLAVRQESAIAAGGGVAMGSRQGSTVAAGADATAAAQVPAEHDAEKVEQEAAEEHALANKLDHEDIDDETRTTLAVAARGEHNHAQLGLCEGPRMHITELGSGIVYYFEFIKFIGAISLIFAILQIIHYAKFADQRKPPFDSRTDALGTRAWYNDLMITGYTDGDYATWMAMNIMSIILTFFAGPIYYFIMWRREVAEDKDSLTQDGLIEKADRLLRIDTKTGLFDVSHHYRSGRELFVRRLGSVLIILTFLGVQTVASYFLTRESSNAPIGIAFAIAIIGGALMGFFTFVSQFVVEFAKIQTYGRWKTAHTVSLMAIRLGNVVAVYAAKKYKLDPDTKCAYDIVGEQFISLLFVEIIVMNVVNVVLHMILNKLAGYIAIKTSSVYGDEDNLPPFDLATFYLNIVYRHYIVIMAMVVAPLTVCFAFLGFVLQYWVDKFLLFKICGTPRRIYNSQKMFLSVTLFCVALCSLLTPYAGSMFIMSGITGEFSELCQFPRHR